MEVTSNLQSAGVFKPSELCPLQQNTDMTSGHLNNISFSSSLPQTAGDPDKGQTSVFTNTEPLTTIQKQDIAPSSSFSVPRDTLVQQGSQQFLLEPREGLGQDLSGGAAPGVGRLCGESAPRPQQLALFPPDEVAQLEEAVRQLKAKGFCNLPLQPDNSQQQQHLQHQLQKQQIQQQQLQQQQALENLQQQLFQSQIQMQCEMFQDVAQKNEQQSSPRVAPNQASLFQQPPPPQQQQPVPLYQSSELLSIQTNFMQQAPSHPSPPVFHNSPSLAETPAQQGALFQKASQEQVQATLFQNPMSVLQSPEQQPSTNGLFLPQTSLPSQLTTNNPQQQQQMAFLNVLQTPNPEQSVFQAQTQLSPIQQRSPMEQQPPTQPQPQPAPQASLFQNIPAHPSANTLSSNQQQQQPGLLFCNSRMTAQDPASGLMFSGQSPMSQMAVSQQDRSEPMSLGNPTDPRQQVLFQEQQSMQLGPSSGNQQESPVGLFMPQSNMTSLQEELAVQAQASLFTTQNSVASLQTTTSSPVQQPGTLFQNAVSGNISQANPTRQSELFLFGIQNDCGQLMNPAGNTVSDQIIAISQSGQNQRESDARIQSLLNQSMSQPASVQNSMTVSHNIEKMDELLVSLHESASSLTNLI